MYCITCSAKGAPASMLWIATFPAIKLASVSSIILKIVLTLTQKFKLLGRAVLFNKI